MPRRETIHHRRWGLLVRSDTWVESEWDAEQRGWMLALAVLEAETCPLCGGPREECQSAEADEAWQAEPVRCHRSTAIAVAADRYRDNPHPESLLWRTTRRRRG